VNTLRVGIASYDEMKALTLAIAQGKRKLASGEPRVWFPSTESFARVLSAGNRELLRTIAEKAPGSLEELAVLTGRKKPNLSRTLKTMANYGLVRLEPGPRRTIAPKVLYDRIELELPLKPKEHAA
jgi:predicted transcriptional regulator